MATEYLREQMELEIRTKLETYLYMGLGLFAIGLGVRFAYLEVFLNAIALILIGVFMCRACFQRSILSVSAKADSDRLTYFYGSHFSNLIEYHEILYRDITQIKSLKKGRKAQLLSPSIIIDLPMNNTSKELLKLIVDKNPSVDSSEISAFI